jgi:hypothetical protein
VFCNTSLASYGVPLNLSRFRNVLIHSLFLPSRCYGPLPSQFIMAPLTSGLLPRQGAFGFDQVANCTDIIVAVSVFLALTWVSVALRFWTRTKLVKIFGWDDTVLAITLVCMALRERYHLTRANTMHRPFIQCIAPPSLRSTSWSVANLVLLSLNWSRPSTSVLSQVKVEALPNLHRFSLPPRPFILSR